MKQKEQGIPSGWLLSQGPCVLVSGNSNVFGGMMVYNVLVASRTMRVEQDQHVSAGVRQRDRSNLFASPASLDITVTRRERAWLETT